MQITSTVMMTRIILQISEGKGSREKTGKAVCERKNKTGETNSTGKEKSEYGKVKK